MLAYQQGRQKLVAQAHARGTSPEDREKQLAVFDGQHQQSAARYQGLQAVAGRAARTVGGSRPSHRPVWSTVS